MNAFRSMVLISSDPKSMQKGAQQVFDLFQKEIKDFGLEKEISLQMVEDIGKHESVPMVIVYPDAVVYGPVKTENVHNLVEEHLSKGHVLTELQAPQNEISGKIAWISARKGALPAEQRIVLENVGVINPDSIDDYISHDGYKALKIALTNMKPEEVYTLIEKSGLRGRGGAGFPTGTKWKFVAKTPGQKKYVICNADESEPGTFKDRTLLEGDPFVIIEAMSIAGFAVGANEGYVYVRGEYALSQNRLNNAIQQARKKGFIGEHILGTDFNFNIHVHSGAGAYICGEETALIESIEGKRGEPRARPPYPTTNGLHDKPTLVNNVETLANIPAIIRNGADWYKSFGTPSSPGTKVYMIMGHVNRTGVIEVPMGITLREVIAIYAKGMKSGSTFKFAQTGGSSGSIIPSSLQDSPMDFDSFSKTGVALGSGALLICNTETCVVDLAKVLLNFFVKESCGKCNPCRIGTVRAYQILDNITHGIATLTDLDDLQMLSDNMYEMSNCGLGQTAGSPLRDILKYYRAEVEAHIRLKVCPTGACPMDGLHK